MSFNSITTRSGGISDQLIHDIITINKAWKAAKELLGDTALTRSYRALKNRRQAKLLREYGPTWVYLELDTTEDHDEPLYGLKLTEQVGNRTDIAHLPVRIANELFSPEELASLTK